MNDRERVHIIDTERSGDGTEELDQREQLLKLRADTRLAAEAYMASLRDSNLLVPGFSDDEREGEVSVMHQVYMQMMMQACLKPLSRGVNTNAVIQAAGMMVAMRTLSPDFRKEMGSCYQPLKDKIQDRIDRRTRSMGAWAENLAESNNSLVDQGTRARLEKNPSLAGNEKFMRRREDRKTGRGDYLSKKWQGRLDDLEHRDRGNREMYTPDSAAMTEVGLMENAFWKMREPGADVGRIHDSYRSMRKRLHDQMDEDGLDRLDIVKRARMLIGERMEYEPELRTMFNGVAHGRIVKAPTHQERLAGTDCVREVWSGEFDDHLGNRLPDDGMFTLRRPMAADVHQVQLAETMKTSMLEGLAGRDREGFISSVQGYMVGFAARRHGFDTQGLPDALRQRLDQTETMIATLDIDGFTSGEQQRIYSNAYVDAMEAVGREHPDLAHELTLAFGENWQETLQAAVDDPAAFAAAERIRPRPFRQGTGRAEQPDGNARPAGPGTGADAGAGYQPA
jgi:hypothetical protein